MQATLKIVFESPLAPVTVLTLANGARMSVSALADLPSADRERLIPSVILRSQIERVALRELVLPGADRWRLRVSEARPADPVWVPALERNARVLEIALARDALADPWHPTRFSGDGINRISVVGSAAQQWVGGDVSFDVWVMRPTLGPQRVRYTLLEGDRERLWDHLTGLLEAMRIRRGQVELVPPAEALRVPVGNISMMGVGLRSTYVADNDQIARVMVREDGQFRRDQQQRTEIAEAHAWLLRRWSSEGVAVVVPSLPTMQEYNAMEDPDDLGTRKNFALRWFGLGAATATAITALVVSKSQTVRDWLSPSEEEP